MISAELPVKISFILLAGVAGSHESDGPCDQSQSNSTCQGAADVGDRRHIVALEILGALEGQCRQRVVTVVNASAAVPVDRTLHLAFPVSIPVAILPVTAAGQS